MTDAHRNVVVRDITELRQILVERPAAYMHVGPGYRTQSLVPIEHLLEAFDEAVDVLRALNSAAWDRSPKWAIAIPETGRASEVIAAAETTHRKGRT